MASLSTTIASLSIPSACTFSNPRPLLLPFQSKKTVILSKKLSCQAAHDKGSADHNGNPRDGASRRNLLIGLGGLYGTVGGLSVDPKALGAPIQPPDFAACGPSDLPSGAIPINCCPPIKTITDFQPPTSGPVRVRQAAHLVDNDYLKKYTRAVELMKALPPDDPRNFFQQANVHCAYCDGAYDQVGFPGLELQVHSSWLFFPWHRFYLYFHERILASLIDDDTFALPFWNWDGPAGMQLPCIYTNPCSTLYEQRRDPGHQPPVVAVLDFNPDQPSTASCQQLIDANLKIMYRQVISGGETAELFMGEPYRAGDQPDPGAGTLERVPHNTMHTWTGDPRLPNRELMGVFYTAGRDPIFYAHHSNIDRLWSVWKTLGGQRVDFTDSDWLDASFLFYDENAQLVRVKVSQCLDTEQQLLYKFQAVDNLWINAKPEIGGTGKAGVTPRLGPPTFPVSLEKANVSVTVARPDTKTRKGNEVETLLLQGIEYDPTVFIKFDVYVNASPEALVSAAVAECAGSFTHVPHLHRKGKGGVAKTNVKLGITGLLGDIGATGDQSVVVTLVPRSGTAKIGAISIKLLT